MKHEYEVVDHSVVRNFKVFLVNLDYRAPHIHRDFEICFLLSGSVTVFLGEARMTFSQNDFFVFNPLQSHELRANPHALILSVQIPSGFCRDYYPAIADTEFLFCSGRAMMERRSGAFFRTAVFMAQAYFAMEEGFELLCVGKINELLYELVRFFPYKRTFRETQKKQLENYERIRRMIEYIDAHYTEKLLLSELAEKENLSLTYLSHFFRDCLQISFREYLTSLRCEKARQLLLLTDLNLLDVSMDCGFSDIKYLNRSFQKQYGYSPREYRKRFDLSDLPSKQLSILSTQEFLSRRASLVTLEKIISESFELKNDA